MESGKWWFAGDDPPIGGRWSGISIVDNFGGSWSILVPLDKRWPASRCKSADVNPANTKSILESGLKGLAAIVNEAIRKMCGERQTNERQTELDLMNELIRQRWLGIAATSERMSVVRLQKQTCEAMRGFVTIRAWGSGQNGGYQSCARVSDDSRF